MTHHPPVRPRSARRIGISALVAVLLLALAAVVTSPAALASGKTVDVTLADLSIKPGTITVASGTDLTLHVTNAGAITHNLKEEGKSPGTKDLKPGTSADLELGKVTAPITLWCTIPGHKAAGMSMTVNVTGKAAASHTAAMHMAKAGASSTQFDSKDQSLDPSATPPKDFVARDPSLAPVAPGTTHDVTFHIQDKVLEVAPGVKQRMWTFNGTVPGPILHGRIGDTFNVTVVNDATMTHNIDFHASQTSMDVDMAPIQPGKSLTYSFKAEYSGIWMYHCGTAPALQHIGNGMYGAVVIDPPTLAPVQHEWALVQSELYFGPKNQPSDYAKMQAFAPDAVVFNGYASQYSFNPLHVKVGDRIRIWVLDAGPSENSSFHIVGTIFDTVFKEGAYILRRNNPEGGGSQAMDLQPAQGGYVEFQVRKPGKYAIVTHKFVNVGKGALGMIMAE
ncbi:MAG: multicopper oxidase domain-containing protein [Acidimicrobiia bacterium]